MWKCKQNSIKENTEIYYFICFSATWETHSAVPAAHIWECRRLSQERKSNFQIDNWIQTSKSYCIAILFV